jgi:hypothetical protein
MSGEKDAAWIKNAKDILGYVPLGDTVTLKTDHVRELLAGYACARMLSQEVNALKQEIAELNKRLASPAAGD